MVGIVYLDPGNPRQSPSQFFAAEGEEEVASHIEEYRRSVRRLGFPPALVEAQVQIGNLYELPLEGRRLPDLPIPAAIVVAGYVGVEWEIPSEYPSYVDTELYDRVT